MGVKHAISHRIRRGFDAAQRLTFQRTVSTERLGLRLELDLRDNVQREVYKTGRYEPELLNVLARELRQGDVYLDVGAHIGLHAMLCARRLLDLGGGTVIAFEPTPDSAGRLERALVVNGITNVTLVRAAVGDRKGVVELRADPAFGRDDAAVRSAYGPGRVIGRFDQVALDDRPDLFPRLDVIKIDIEGAEFAALAGMRGLLERHQPRLIVAEAREYLLHRAGSSPQAVRDLLAGIGYRVVDDLEGNLVFRRVPS
jgi:FkbM family methyltransferase